MSSSEDTHKDDDNARTKRNKKRRMRACDMCRRRKVKCDGGIMPENICTNCITFKSKCTYTEAASKRFPDAGYVENLENELVELRKTVEQYRQLCPNATFNDPTSTPSTAVQSPFSPEVHSPILRQHQHPHACTTTFNPISLSPVTIESDDLDSSDDEATARKKLVRALDDMSFYPRHDHFLGKSSNLMLLQTAMDMREEYKGSEGERTGAGARASEKSPLLEERRPEFWAEHPWVERLSEHSRLRLVFPDADLIDPLVEYYFVELNVFMPLLHRPTFERNVREGLHRREVEFGCVLLLVCALGSRYSDDPRVVLENPLQEPSSMSDLAPEEEQRAKRWSWHSAGWKWFRQVQDYKCLLNLEAPTLADLQILCLASMFAHGTSSPHVAWGYIGVGIRYAQDLGAHRRKTYSDRSALESEPLKRAFWLLLFLDRAISGGLGRPCGIQDEDIDVELPIACDDEYWINPDPNLAFKQPEGKPSTVAYFNCALRLAQIHAFALRTIYSINKWKALLGFVGPKWEQHIVAELDSTMNRWIDSVPDHLRWNPHMDNLVFLSQSALLYGSYYTIQIAVHRPFIPSPRKPSGISFPSLAICTNAARSCVHVLDVHSKRVGRPLPLSLMALFGSGIVLLVNIWGAKRSGSIADPVKEMKEVHKVMNMLKTLEKRWYSAGRLWDILYNLANVGDLPLPAREVRMSQKRTRSSDDATASSTPSDGAPPADEARRMAGTRRVQQYQAHASTSSGSEPFAVHGDATYSLPVHSDELGRLPLHPFFGMGMGSGMGWLPPDSFGALPGPSPPPPPPSVPVPASAPPAQAGPPAPFEPLDAASFEAIFSMFPPASYEAAPGPSQGAGAPFAQSLTSVLSENLGQMIAQEGAPVAQAPPVAEAQNSLENGALAMWSDAPSGFEWDDWSTYVSTFGAAGL